MRTRLLVPVLATWLPFAAACESETGGPNPGDPNVSGQGQAGSAGTSMSSSMTTAGSGGTTGTGAAGTTASAGSGAAGSMAAAGSGAAGGSNAAGSGGGTAGAAGTGPAIDPRMPFGPNADVFVWSTERFALEPGQERYLCYAKTLQEDLVINAYNSRGDSFVHHLILSRARSPEPEGFAECDVAFKNSWETLFITGAGDTTLEFPADAGHQLAKGTQLVVQMHLLNTATTKVEGALTINMRRSSAPNPRPVNSFIFGTAAVELPAHETTQVVGTCSPWQPVKLIAGFPHMHLLGTSLKFEVGSSAGDMREVFKRDPFDFDNQRIDKVDVTVNAGDVTRVSCTFDNTLDQTVGYGESTRNEMCYFVGFAVDLPGMSACLEVLPPNIFGN